MGRGSDIEIFGSATQHQVAYPAAHETSEVSRVDQAIEDLQDVGVDVAARDRMLSAFDYARFQLPLLGNRTGRPHRRRSTATAQEPSTTATALHRGLESKFQMGATTVLGRTRMVHPEGI